MVFIPTRLIQLLWPGLMQGLLPICLCLLPPCSSIWDYVLKGDPCLKLCCWGIKTNSLIWHRRSSVIGLISFSILLCTSCPLSASYVLASGPCFWWFSGCSSPHSGDTQHFLCTGAPSSNEIDIELQYEKQNESDLLLVKFYFISSNLKHFLIIKSISENNDVFLMNTNWTRCVW